MSSWFGNGISQITGQISSFTKEVLTEGTEEVDDHATQLKITRDRLIELDTVCTAQRAEIERLNKTNEELQEKVESSELQIAAISTEYRNIIHQKESEIQQLQHQHHALIEASHKSTDPHLGHEDHFEDHGSYDVAYPKQNVTEAAQQQHHYGNSERQASSPGDHADLEAKIQALQTQLISEKDSHQAEQAALQDIHSQKVVQLKKKHKEEVRGLKEELSVLHNSTQHDGSSLDTTAASVKVLQEQVRHLESVTHKQSVDLSHIHAADKQKTELLETCQGQLTASQRECKQLKLELTEVQMREKSLLEDLDAVTDDNRRLKDHLAQMSLSSAFSPTASTPKKRPLSPQSDEFEDRTIDDSIISSGDFSQVAVQTRRLDDQVTNLQGQVDKYEREIEHFEMVKSDWLVEKEALEEVLMKLREQLTEKEEALSIAQAEQERTASPPTTDVVQIKEGLLALKQQEPFPRSCDHGLMVTPGEIEEDLEDLNEQVALLTDGSARLENEHDILVIEKEQLLRELHGEKEKVSMLQKQLSAENQDVDDEQMTKLEERLTYLEAELVNKEKEIDRLKKQNEQADVQEEAGDLHQELNVTKSQLEEVTAERESLIESLEELDSQHQQAIQQMIESRQKLQQNNEDLKKQLESVRNESTTDLSKTNDGGLSENELKLEKEVEAFRVQLEETRAGLKLKETNLNQLLADKAKMTEELKTKDSKLQEITLVLNELHMDKKEHQVKIEQLEKELQAVREEVKVSQKERSVLDRECSRFKEELASRSSEIVLLKQENVTQKKGADASELLEEEKRKWEEQVSNLRKELVSMETEVTLVKADNDVLTEQLTRTRTSEESRLLDVTREWEEKLETEKSAMLSVRESMERELNSTEHQMQEKSRQYEQYISELAKSRDLDASELQAEHEKLMKVNHEKDVQINKRDEQLQQLQHDLEYTKEMLQTTIDGQSHITNLLEEKDTEIAELKKENDTLVEKSEEQWNQLKQHEAELERLNHMGKLYKQLAEDHKKVNVENDQLKKQLRDIETEENSEQIESKTLGVITDLEQEVTQLQQSIAVKDATIQELNSQVLDLNKMVEDRNTLVEKTNSTCSSLSDKLAKTGSDLNISKETISKLESEVQEKKDLIVTKDTMIQTLQQNVSNKDSALSEADQKLAALSEETKSQNSVNAKSENQFEDFKEKSVLYSSQSVGTEHIPNGGGPGGSESGDSEIMDEMRKQIEERDDVIHSLKQKNQMLTGLLEERSIALHGDATLVDIHKLESEVRALRMEKEQMMQVLNDKTRECSQLKGDVHKLMNVVSAEKAALSKLQQDNQHLQQHEEVDKPATDMSKDAIKNLSRLIRDKDLEIESLGQKNETLIQVLQESSQEGTKITTLIQERDNLAMQVAVFQNDRQQIVAALNAKHQESVAYHAEIQRLNGLISKENEKQDRLQQEYSALVAQYEDRQKALVATQQELIAFKQRFAEMDNKYKEVLKEKEEILSSREESSREQSPQPELAMSNSLQPELPTSKSPIFDLGMKVRDLSSTGVDVLDNKVTVEVATPLTSSAQVDSNADETTEHSNVNTICCDHLKEIENLRAVIQMHEQAFEDKDKVIRERDHDLHSRDKLIADKDATLDEKVKAYSELSARFHKTEQMLRTRDMEMNSVRKQSETLAFQLHGLQTEVGDLRQEKDQLSSRGSALEQQMEMVKEANNKLSMALKDHAFELNALKEKNNTLTRLLQEKDSDEKEKGEMDRLMKETETLQHQARVFKVDADQFAMALQQQQEENRELKTEFQKVGEREQKLSREVERLRQHLMQVEEGYTRELLEAEEREKDLRNRLAAAEDRALSASSSVDRTNLQASKQVDTLHQQLHSLASQRDQAVLQLATVQEQSNQYAAQLSNLQMVLEQFQQEKEQQQAAEIEFYLREQSALKQEKETLQRELHQLQLELHESNEAVAAAQRLSDQLDRKEEMISALREEVQLRERELSEAEERIHGLRTSVEGKIDKALARNLLLGYFHAPASQKSKVIEIMSKTLDFSSVELQQLQGESSAGWLRGIFKRSSASPAPSQPTTPIRQVPSAGSIDKSFSELFVTFLEKESSPTPQVRLPAEEMAREQQQRRHRPHTTPTTTMAFNPFTATVPSASTPFAASLSSTTTRHDPLGIGHKNPSTALALPSLGGMTSPLSAAGNPTAQLNINTEESTVARNPFSAPVVGRSRPSSAQSTGESHLLMAAVSTSLPLFTASSLQTEPAPRSSTLLKQAMQQS